MQRDGNGLRRRIGLRAARGAVIVVVCALAVGCSRDAIDKGYACLQLGDYAMAIEFFDRELHKNPRDFDARLGMGKALLQKAASEPADTGAWGRALTHLEAARTLDPHQRLTPLLSEAWLYRARSLFQGHDTLEGLSALSRAIEYDPKRLEAINLAGIIYSRIGAIKKSQALFSRAVAIDSSHPTSHFNLGMAYWQRQRYDSAHVHWMAALRLDPDDEDALYWFAVSEQVLREGESQ
jgi:tetratricopeptide (TPR) repeat protein